MSGEAEDGVGVPKRLVVMAHFDPDGLVAPHVRRQIEAWLQLSVRLIVVSTAALVDEARDWLATHAELIQRANYGYDFLSYKEGLATGGDLAAYDEVVICNDTYVGPLRPYAAILGDMAEREVDFWGMARCNRRKPHIQSYFAVFRPQVVASAAFREFWDAVQPLASRGAVIRRYEVGMSVRLRKAGFRFGSYFREDKRERRLGRLRVIWWVLRRQPSKRSGGRLQRLWEDAHEPWNPAAAVADSALAEAKFPLVKIDTLRHDPYGLDADRLLALCEQAYPAEFAGVSDYLERTASSYPTRKGEGLRPTPWWLKPFGPLVAYRR